jgi:phosphopantetheine adenylyltransferase
VCASLAGPLILGPLGFVETRFAISAPEFSSFSSTKVRNAVVAKQSIRGMVPAVIEPKVEELYSR